MKKKITLRIATAILLIILSCSACGLAQKLEWPSCELAQIVPQLSAEYGEVAIDTSDTLVIRAESLSREQYESYVEECKKEGFTIDVVEDAGRSFSAFNDDGYLVEVSLQSDYKTIELTVNDSLEKNFGAFTWPTSEVGSLVPIPKSQTGFIYWENSNGFVIYVGETSKDEYHDYVHSCEEAGFTIDYNKGDDYFWADDAYGNQVTVRFKRNETMWIRADAGGESDSSPAPENSNAGSSTQSPTGVGETQTIKDFEATITGYEFSDYAGALNGLSKAEDGFKYCVIYLDAKNIGTQALEPDDYVFRLYYNTDYSYLSTWGNYTQFLNAHDSIPALGVLKEVCVCFKVPDEVEINNDLPLMIELKENLVKAKEKVTWVLR